MRRASRVVVLTIVVVFATTAPSTTAQTVEPIVGSLQVTTVLPANASLAYVAPLAALDSLRFSVVVTQGAPVDVFVVDTAGYSAYTGPAGGSLLYYEAGTRLNTASFEATFTAPRGADYYLIVDNAPRTAGGAPGSGPVTVTVTAEVLRFPTYLIVAVVLGLALAIIAMIFYLRLRRATRAAASRPEGPAPRR